MNAVVDFDGLMGLGYGSGWGRTQGDGAEMVSRMHIMEESERDIQRQRERDAEPVVPMRWRFHDGTWQRWSDLDRAFVAKQPPGTLLEHVAATGEPVEDQELIFDGDSWEVADDLAEEAEAPESPVADVWGQPSAPDGEREAVSFEQQLDAWRKRR